MDKNAPRGRWVALALAISLVALGCATPVQLKRLGTDGEIPWPPTAGEGYLAMNLHIGGGEQGDVFGAGCFLQLETVVVDAVTAGYQSGQIIDLPVQAGASVETFALPAGRFEFQGFLCGRGRGNLDTFKKTTFNITAGRISYLGAWVIGAATASESRDADARLADWTRSKLPSLGRSQVISGYTEKAIPEDILMSGRHSPGLSLSFRKGASEADVATFQKEVGTCAATETQAHRFGLGRVKFEARAKGAPSVVSSGSFSDEFVACVTSAVTRGATSVPGLKGVLQ